MDYEKNQKTAMYPSSFTCVMRPSNLYSPVTIVQEVSPPGRYSQEPYLVASPTGLYAISTEKENKEGEERGNPEWFNNIPS